MDWLRVLGSLTTNDSRALVTAISDTLSVHTTAEGARLCSNTISLTLSESAAGEYLLRGEVESLSEFERDVLLPVWPQISSAQIDVFEEDGRLVKRLCHP